MRQRLGCCLCVCVCVCVQVAKWGGRLLLHEEQQPKVETEKEPLSGPQSFTGSFQARMLGQELDSSRWEASLASAQRTAGTDEDMDDITAPTAMGGAVAPFWEEVDMQQPYVLLSPRALMESLASDDALVSPGGVPFRLSYSRVPLSRERTPVASDVADLHQTILQAEQLRNEGNNVVHLILSRTATGTSARFVASVLGSYYVDPPAPTDAAHGHSPPRPSVPPPPPTFKSPSKGLSAQAGEYRGIMALCRLLPNGIEAKSEVDQAINKLRRIGHILEDIHLCVKSMGRVAPSGPSSIPVGMGEAETGGGPASNAVAQPGMAAPAPVTEKSEKNDAMQYAARQLGIHYLKRYFLLLCFRTYLSLGINPVTKPFDKWVAGQRELQHLLNHLTLDT